ncbi:MAG: phosphoadenosine phosphosulfate reductase family protein [Tannerellaceae bacterium]|jgi:3'-phosphoadenosine 5'-phosphosulfate sulfotransferase (PAPS reductase)/FAD synthetase|nr:phosphoadenosine phosphosulfate reductase family protein [Tannerellaceae bacterium]
MRTIVTFSGGKDSLAALLWVRENFTKNFATVFCDTGWEHPLTYQYIEHVKEKLGLDLVVLKSKKYDGMIDLAMKKKRFPSTMARFCTSELKAIPTIDYLLDEVKDDFVVVQGIRGAESASRAKMKTQCNYFKYYLEPYGQDKNGKDKFHTYRRKEIIEFAKTHATDVLRPVFRWSAQSVIDYILNHGLEPNPLYRMGFKRVGCFPCVMSANPEIYQIIERFPERITEIAEYERTCKSSFFGPDAIPKHAHKGSFPLITDVGRYIKSAYARGTLFDNSEGETALSCMSYYSGLCE